MLVYIRAQGWRASPHLGMRSGLETVFLFLATYLIVVVIGGGVAGGSASVASDE